MAATLRRNEDTISFAPSGSIRPPVALTVGLLLVIAVTITAGCAKITYQKVPSPVQWGSNWTIEKQIEADKMEGPRFYLPRPFLVVKTPVPIAARVAFISLEYDQSQKKYKLSLPSEAEAWVKRLLPNALTISQALKLKLATEGPGKQEAAATGKAAEESGKGEEAPPKEGTAKKEEPAPPTTVIGRVTSLYKEDPVTKLGELFDVVYLPDFDEQFVIGRSFGLGKGDVQISLRNGWAAEVFGEQIDRSNLIPYVINQVENASKAALNVARDWGLMSAGIPVGALPLPSIGVKQEALGAGEDTTRALDMLGQTVLLKVVEIRVAQPGIYPILKPREILDWFGVAGQRVIISAATPDAALAELLNQKGLSWIRPDLAFIPAPPFTMVGFNIVNDAYIGTVTKDQMGLGLHTVEQRTIGGGTITPGPQPVAKDAIEKALAAKKTALGTTAGKVGGITVASKVNNTEVTVTAANASSLGQLVQELNDKLAQEWAKATFELSPAQVQDVKASPNAQKTAVIITFQNLPLSTLNGRIKR
jgi:hypothetical protein